MKFSFLNFFSAIQAKSADPLPKLDPGLVEGLTRETRPFGPRVTAALSGLDRDTDAAYALRDAEPEPKSYVCGARPKLHGVGR